MKLTRAKREIARINNTLLDKTVFKLELKLYKYKTEEESNVVYPSDEGDFLLLLKMATITNNTNTMISVASILGIHTIEHQYVEMRSNTDYRFHGRKFNLFLRAVLIHVLSLLTPRVLTICSHSTNPISTYVMCKYFKAFNSELYTYLSKNELCPDTISFQDILSFYEWFRLNDPSNNQSALEYLNTMVAQFTKLHNKSFTLSMLGFNSELEGIRFVKTTMNFSRAITLTLNIDDNCNASSYAAVVAILKKTNILNS